MTDGWTQVLAMDVAPGSDSPAWTQATTGSVTIVASGGILTITDTSTSTPSTGTCKRSLTAADVYYATMKFRTKRTAGNDAAFGNYAAIYSAVGSAYVEMISTGLRIYPSGATLALSWADYHEVTISKRGTVFDVDVDDARWLTGQALDAYTAENAFVFGSGSSAATGTGLWDWVKIKPGVENFRGLWLGAQSGVAY